MALVDPEQTKQDILSVVDDEAIRSRIRQLADPPRAWWQRLFTHPLGLVLIPVMITVLFGTWLTNRYGTQQKAIESERTETQRESDRIRTDQERQSDRLREDQQRESDRIYQERQKEFENQRALAQRELERVRDQQLKETEYRRYLQQRDLERERSFNDELNKIRVAKIAEVWETIDMHTAEFDQLISTLTEAENRENSDEKKKQGNRLGELLLEEVNIVNKNRFWLGEENFTQIKRYHEHIFNFFGDLFDSAMHNLVVGVLSLFGVSSDSEGPPSEQEIEEFLKKKDILKQNVLQVRERLLKEGAAPSLKGDLNVIRLNNAGRN